MTENIIRVEGLSKSYDGKTVFRRWSAQFPRGELSCIMAPSGRGKTTLLRILMGLENPDEGTVTGLEGLRLSAVFQEDRLCDHLSAVSNIRLVTPSLRGEEVLRAMERMGLTDCAAQPVREFSGGMRRRVALLRALLAEYDLLLMDEPFKGLDTATRELVLRETRRLCAGRTVLLVTHDESEGQALGAVQTVFIP